MLYRFFAKFGKLYLHMATIDDFQKLDIRVGKIIEVNDFPEAKKPAYKLRIDFGSEIGIKNSSVQIVVLYSKEELLGMLVLGVVIFRILGDVAEIACGADALSHLVALDGREVFDLFLEALNRFVLLLDIRLQELVLLNAGIDVRLDLVERRSGPVSLLLKFIVFALQVPERRRKLLV